MKRKNKKIKTVRFLEGLFIGLMFSIGLFLTFFIAGHELKHIWIPITSSIFMFWFSIRVYSEP